MLFHEFPILIRDTENEFSPMEKAQVTLDLFRIESFFESPATGKVIITMDSGDEYTLELSYSAFKSLHKKHVLKSFAIRN